MIPTIVSALIERAALGLGYHGTLASNVESIREHGLRSDGLCIYLAKTPKQALMWAEAMHPGKPLAIVTVRHNRPLDDVIQVPRDIRPDEIVDIKLK